METVFAKCLPGIGSSKATFIGLGNLADHQPKLPKFQISPKVKISNPNAKALLSLILL